MPLFDHSWVSLLIRITVQAITHQPHEQRVEDAGRAWRKEGAGQTACLGYKCIGEQRQADGIGHVVQQPGRPHSLADQAQLAVGQRLERQDEEGEQDEGRYAERGIRLQLEAVQEV